MGVMESRSGRPGRDAERLGDLRRRVPEVVVQYEDGALLRRQASEATFEEVSVAHSQQLVGSRRSVDREHPQAVPCASLMRIAGE